jgi:nucleoside phosphorylase
MIVVTFALPTESSAFIRSLKNVRRDGAMVRGELKHRTSNVEHRRVDSPSPYPLPQGKEDAAAPGEGKYDLIGVLHTGVGAAKCEQRLGNFLRAESPELLIASGFCGGTTDELQPGDLVIADNASDLSKKAHAVLPDAVVGKIHSSNRIIDPAVDRYEIGREHGAIAIDMETETIARLCAERSIPVLALRVISDSPAAPFPAPPGVLFDIEAQRTKFTALVTYLARDPASAVRLAQFSQQITRAKTKLADALCAVIHAL